MGANITIGGIVNRMRRIKNPYNKKGQEFDWICLDIETGGVAPPPKGLPKVGDTEYTCILNEKQYKTLTQEMEAYDLRKIKGRYVVVQGEITLDLPLEVLDRNEIGVVTYRVKSKEVETIKEEISTGKEYLPLKEIIIESQQDEEDPEEIENHIDFYLRKSSFKQPITVKQDPANKKWVLVDGMDSYRAALNLKLEKVIVDIIG